MSNTKLGFTLIELLIVITIIGILAGAVFAALNPLERIRRAQDARLISQGKDIVDACERYVVTNGACVGCGALSSELKSANVCTGMTMTCDSVQGTCKVTTPAVKSAYYTTICGAADGCIIPDEIARL